MENELELYKELLQVQEELRLTTDSKSTGKTFSFCYLSLPGLLEIVLPVLKKHNMYLHQPLRVIDMKAGPFEVLNTQIKHTNGAMIYSETMISQDWVDIKDWSAHVTTKRRVAIMCLLGLQQQKKEEDAEQRDVKRESEYISPAQVGKILFETKSKPKKRQILIDRYNKLELIPRDKMSEILDWIAKDVA